MPDQYLGYSTVIREAIQRAEGEPYDEQSGRAVDAIVKIDPTFGLSRARALVKKWRAANG